MNTAVLSKTYIVIDYTIHMHVFHIYIRQICTKARPGKYTVV
jgi:hypothetical protein